MGLELRFRCPKVLVYGFGLKLNISRRMECKQIQQSGDEMSLDAGIMNVKTLII